MKVAFLHYHLKTGGVTTVIKQQVQAIASECEVLVISGEPATVDFGVPVLHVPGVAYNTNPEAPDNSADTADKIVKGIAAHWETGCDVLHVHNPTLAKNVHFLKILKAIQQRGIALFLQIHDFAEDGRSGNYFFDEPYLENCHYGVINSRDYQILINAGLKPEGLHLIANNVPFLNLKPPEEKLDIDVVLYPIRAIRRKNIGEAILLSIFHPHQEVLAITLPPNSRMDLDCYEGWRAFVADRQLRVIFEASRRYSFEMLYHFARFIITTSINEGFGFCFLEPWTAKKALYGRLIPEICSDFNRKRIVLDHLYQTLRVPVDWLDLKALATSWKAAVAENYRLFKQSQSPERIDRGFEKLISDGTIDFGLLSENFQKQTIARVLAGSSYRQRFMGLNPFAFERLYQPLGKEIVLGNDEMVRRHYSKRLYKQNLLQIYDRVLNKSVSQRIKKAKVVDRFLNMDNFSLLKWSPYDSKGIYRLRENKITF